MAGRNISVSETSRPILPRHTKLRFDETRQVWVILAPERVLAPDEIAVEVLKLCDGARSVADVVDLLAEKYAAPRDAKLSSSHDRAVPKTRAINAHAPAVAARIQVIA